MASVYIGLAHYPIYNKNMQVVTTAITNFDMHDIARTARTYGIARYFIIHPQEAQQTLVRDIAAYWQEGYGGQHHPDRREAFRILCLLPTIEAAAAEITALEGAPPIIVATDARTYPNTISYRALRRRIAADGRPCLILFGTGWGIEKETMRRFDYILEPIYGSCDYNHLPVRAAAAVILDRLLGEAWFEPPVASLEETLSDEG